MNRSVTKHMTRVGRPGSTAGFTLVESMVAMVVLSIGIIGTIGMCEWAQRGLQRGAMTTTALALAESCLEAKRSLPWDQLLADDLDQNGTLESLMRDDGLLGDETNGDGIFTGSLTRSNIRLVWTVELNRGSRPGTPSLATIEARASFTTLGGQPREVRVRTIRANPRALSSMALS